MKDAKVTIKEVSALSVHSARYWHAQPREATISITGTSEPRVCLKKGWAHVLRLCFDDTEPAGLFFVDNSNIWS